jgi:hypothetical protein
MSWFRRRPVRLLALTLRASMIVPLSATLMPAVADRSPSERYVVVLAQIERFAGSIAPVTIVCPSKGTCTGQAHVEVRGKTFMYILLGGARGDGRLSSGLVETSRSPSTPRLYFGQDSSLDVALQPDGTGVRDGAVTALLERPWGLDDGITIRPSGQERIPLANVRVTVRREDAEEGNR